MMKLIITFALLVLVAVSAVIYLKYRLNDTPDSKDLETTLDSEVKKLTKNDPSYGLVVGIYKDGKSFIKGYRTVSEENTTVPGASTVFQIASVNKLFTASLLQILCDEGVLKMDATLGELIGGSTTLSPAAQRVTLKQLVMHTSGFISAALLKNFADGSGMTVWREPALPVTVAVYVGVSSHYRSSAPQQVSNSVEKPRVSRKTQPEQ